MKSTLFIALMGLMLAFTSGTALGQESTSNPQTDVDVPDNKNLTEVDSIERTVYIESQADRFLRQMGDYLKSAGAFTVQSESSYDVLEHEGQNIRYGGIAEVALRRTEGLRAAFKGDERQTEMIFNAKTATMYDFEVNMYAVADVPPDLDSAIDSVFDRYGFSVPIADLVSSDPYDVLIADVIEGRWIGRHVVEGVPCNHLAFIQETIDFQVWIEDGAQPVPWQLLITYKNEPGSPQYLVRLTDWNFKPQFSADYFQFIPPEGSDRMEFLTITEVEVEGE